MKFIIYTTKTNSYIVPEETKLPKNFDHSFEIECEVPICDKKIKLAKKVEKIDDVAGIIQNLHRLMNEEELKPYEVNE